MNVTQTILEQGQALFRAIEAPEAIEPTGPIEKAIAWLLLQAAGAGRALLGCPAWQR